MVEAEVLPEYTHFDTIPLTSPTAVALDDYENLYVAESSKNHVLVYNSKRQHISSLTGLAGPITIAVDALGRIYVGNAGRDNVEVYSSDLQFLHKLGTGDGEFQLPAAIAVASNGDVYVADRQAHVIKLFRADGSTLTFGAHGSGNGQFNKPVSIVVDEHTDEMELLVSDMPLTQNGGQFGMLHEGARVQIFTPDGQFKRSFGTPGQGNGKLTKPLGLDVDAAGRIFITDAYQHIIQVFDTNGIFLGVVYDKLHQVRLPLGIAVGLESGRIFTVSYGMETVEVYGQVTTYGVTAHAGSGGTIDPAGITTVRHGESVSYTFTPETDYEVAGVTIDGTNIGTPDEYTFSWVLSDHLIEVEFSRIKHTITATSSTHGTILPAGETIVLHGDDQTFTFTPDTGNHISSVLVDGKNLSASANYSFTDVVSDHTIHVDFALDTFSITSSANNGGTIQPKGKITAEYGSNVDYTLVPDQGYHIDDILIDGVSQGPHPGYSFTGIDSDHTIQVIFARNEYTITADVEGNGEIVPAGVVTALYDDDRTFTFSPAEGFAVDSILVDGVSMWDCDSYTFTAIDANHTLTAIFKSTNESPIALAGPDQLTGEDVTVLLNGLNSYDPDGSIVTYRWEQLDGVPVTLIDPYSALTSFVSPLVNESGESLSFRLTVQDSRGKQTTDDCLINISWENLPPVAEAGPDLTVSELEKVVLDGTVSHDPDSNPLSCRWEQVSGIPVQLSNPNTCNPFFYTTAIETAGAACMFRLTVTDSHGLRSCDTNVVNISKSNPAPIAEAGMDLILQEGEEVVLDSTDSFDPEGETLAVVWKQTDGLPVTLSSSISATTSFTAPEVDIDGSLLNFQLRVTDPEGLIAMDTVSIEVKKAVISDVEIAQGSINPESRGKWITVHVEFPEIYSIESINIDSVELTNINGVDLDQPLTRKGPSEISDNNNNGIPDLMVKFDRSDLLDLLGTGPCQITLQGELLDGLRFEQIFIVTVQE